MHHVISQKRFRRILTPIDTGHNNIVWTRVGVMGNPCWVRGLRRLMVCVISDDAWAVDFYVYNEDQTAFLRGPIPIIAGVGRSGGQVLHDTVMVGENELFNEEWCDWVNFRGRFPGIGTTANSLLRVYGER